MNLPARFFPTTAAAWKRKKPILAAKRLLGTGATGRSLCQRSNGCDAKAIALMSEKIAAESDSEIQSLLSASFARFGQEASARKKYKAIAALCSAFERVGQERPNLAQDLRSRVGVENRLPEIIEEAINSDTISRDLIGVLQQLPKNSVEHLADRFFRSQKREECDRIIDLVGELGEPAVADLREILRLGQPRQSAATVGLLSRLDPSILLELLPGRMSDFNRFYQDIIVRQIAYAAAPDRGRTLLELLELLDPLILPETLDEIGMSQDHSASASLIALAASGEAESRSPFVQLKAIESLGRLREAEAIPVLHEIIDAKKFFGYTQHRELRIAAIQSLSKIDQAAGTQALAEAGWRPRRSRSHHSTPRPDAHGYASAATNASCCRGRFPPHFPARGEGRTS